MLLRVRYILAFILFYSLVGASYGFDTFRIKDIKLEGLQRISVGTVFNYLPVKIGDKMTTELSAKTIRSLYKTGFFKDVRLENENGIMVIFLAEKPAIANIDLEGNSDIPTDQLKDALKQIGLYEGRVFDHSILETIKIELQRQYYALGKYGVKITTAVKPLKRNRIDVSIDIAEGEKAEVYALNIVGSKVYSVEHLRKRLELGEPNPFGYRDDYSKQALTADIETIKSYYLDRGYINFSVDSTQVSITPDKQDVYITLNITEGEQYSVKKIKLAGNLIFPQKEIYSLLSINEGDIFSRKNVSQSRAKIVDRLAEEGYAFANVNLVPDIDKASKTVDLTVFVDPGRRVYVRRINIVGNTKTQDQVIRRESRQFEGSKFSTKLVSQTQTRLNRLGFFENVTVETPAVAGKNDQVDVNYSVSERPTGSLSAGIGYSDTSGALFTFAVTQENFLGTGKRMGVSLSNSESIDKYSVNYTNPYFTKEGVSLGLSVFSEKYDSTQISSTSNYTTNSYGGRTSFGMPISEQQYTNIGLSYKNIELLLGESPASEISDFVSDNGNEFDTYTIEMGWKYDSRNRAIFANEGSLLNFGTEYAVPGGDLEYVKFNLSYLQYFKIADMTTLAFNVKFGHGLGLGETERLPFFENYFAGGSRSVRGYKAGTLGPKETDDEGNTSTRTIGGSSRFIGNLELILPNPFAEHSTSTRLSLFYDTGYAYGADESKSIHALRESVGVALLWLTPVGAMRFSLSDPLDPRPDDQTQVFQFTLGAPF